MSVAHITEQQRAALHVRLVARARVLAEELDDVENALARLDGGTYGLCVDCGNALPYVRLDAVPEAPRCPHCETERERLRASSASL